jgi:hypothetical protein
VGYWWGYRNQRDLFDRAGIIEVVSLSLDEAKLIKDHSFNDDGGKNIEILSWLHE